MLIAQLISKHLNLIKTIQVRWLITRGVIILKMADFWPFASAGALFRLRMELMTKIESYLPPLAISKVSKQGRQTISVHSHGLPVSWIATNVYIRYYDHQRSPLPAAEGVRLSPRARRAMSRLDTDMRD